jgi:hypothetical protein
VFLNGLASPRLLSGNFRPVGHAYFAVAGRAFALDFPRYIPFLHLLHILNGWLVWRIARRLGVSPWAASAGALFFAFHMACFDNYWKPMYVFDVLCATFSLASFLFWTRRNWVLSFLAFWLAYKSKELAVMLPAVFLLYEYWLGKRQWKPLIPFFLVSLSFGLQGLFLNPNRDNDYTFRFTPLAIFTTVRYYASRVFLVPFAGLLLAAVPFFVRDRRVWFALAATLLLFLPLLLLPGRIFSAYCYVPFTCLALAFAVLAEGRNRAVVLACCIVWTGWNEYHLRRYRRQALAQADENRTYIAGVGEFVRANPTTSVFVYDGTPSAMHSWGVTGTLRYFAGSRPLEIRSVVDKDVRNLIRSDSVAILAWNQRFRKLAITARAPGTPDRSYLVMNRETPLWQLDDGWYPQEGTFRWARPDAAVHLRRPPGASAFELTVNMGPGQYADTGGSTVTVRLDGAALGTTHFRVQGWQTARWPLPAGSPGRCRVEIHADPVYHPSNQDPRVLGVAVVSLGFLPKEQP